ncbi:MAG: SpoIIE family protein phosphatase [Candidatus Cloacimonadales bacterium]
MMDRNYVEIDYTQVNKKRNVVCGDVFISKKVKGEDRIVSVLADGLGSGIKANVLASLTATMACNYISNNIDILKAAKIILATLPVCSFRKIGYSTFSIIDIDRSGKARIIEYDNPEILLFRQREFIELEKKSYNLKTSEDRDVEIKYIETHLQLGDRLIFFSDGVTQSGMGKRAMPLGWDNDMIKRYIYDLFYLDPQISCKNLSRKIVARSVKNDSNLSADDITCVALHYRTPRRTMVITGPPFYQENDRKIALLAEEFSGKKIICGGTTSNIIARELQLEMEVNIEDMRQNPDAPPTATMPGFDLITEGTVTMNNALLILKKKAEPHNHDSAQKLVEHLLDSDVIHFVVGTKINPAHQDPNLPVELEIRRNLIRNLAKTLERDYLKETKITFF